MIRRSQAPLWLVNYMMLKLLNFCHHLPFTLWNVTKNPRNCACSQRNHALSFKKGNLTTFSSFYQVKSYNQLFLVPNRCYTSVYMYSSKIWDFFAVLNTKGNLVFFVVFVLFSFFRFFKIFLAVVRLHWCYYVLSVAWYSAVFLLVNVIQGTVVSLLCGKIRLFKQFLCCFCDIYFIVLVHVGRCFFAILVFNRDQSHGIHNWLRTDFHGY